MLYYLTSLNPHRKLAAAMGGIPYTAELGRGTKREITRENGSSAQALPLRLPLDLLKFRSRQVISTRAQRLGLCVTKIVSSPRERQTSSRSGTL